MSLSDYFSEAPEWLEDLLDMKFNEAMKNMTPYQEILNDLYERCE